MSYSLIYLITSLIAVFYIIFYVNKRPGLDYKDYFVAGILYIVMTTAMFLDYKHDPNTLSLILLIIIGVCTILMFGLTLKVKRANSKN